MAGLASTVYVDAAGTCDYPSIQAAVDDLVPGSEIRLVGSQFLLPDGLNLSNRRLSIAGGYPACGASVPQGRTILQAGFSNASLITATGSQPIALDLELRDLVLTGASHSLGDGGGLMAAGQGRITLNGVDVHGNAAEAGGGLHARGFGGPLELVLTGGTRIGIINGVGNQADTGAGVYCRQARLHLGHVDIGSNVAAQQGGGVFADDCEVFSLAEIGDLRIEQNRARDGAGVYAREGSQLALTSAPRQRVSISHNLAIEGALPQRGGGLFLSGAGTALNGHGLRIDNNVARSFAAGIMVVGASIQLDRGTDSCRVGDSGCSSLSGNQVRDASGQRAGNAAAAFVAGTGSPSLSLGQTELIGNSAAGSILSVGDAGTIELSSVLIAANQSNQHLLSLTGSGVLSGDFMTVADNLFSGAAFRNDSDVAIALQLSRSILLVDPGNTHVAGSGNSAFSCLNTGPGGALGGSSHAPGFESASEGRYRLTSGSQNLDQCIASAAASPLDIGGYPRIVDRSDTVNANGAADRGAFEDILLILQDGFEE
jgi:hypothetical protein